MLKEWFKIENPKSLSGGVLAYLGDAVFEVVVRNFLISLGIQDIGLLNRYAVDFVKASSQSNAVEQILPLLSPEEESMFKRGRNASGISAPKSASVVQYRRATGLEALIGYLYLCGENQRIFELFEIAYEKLMQDILTGQETSL